MIKLSLDCADELWEKFEGLESELFWEVVILFDTTRYDAGSWGLDKRLDRIQEENVLLCF